MRLPCPLCGDRDHSEFVYRGDANVVRPQPGEPGTARAFHEYVHLRANPAGWHREHWYHEMGCRSWIVVERNTLTHEVRGAVTAAEHSLARRSLPAMETKPADAGKADAKTPGNGPTANGSAAKDAK